MNDLIERLREQNPVPSCLPPSIDDVWRKLDAGASTPRAGASTSGTHRSGWHRSGWLIGALGALPTAAVVAAAILLLRGAAPAPPPSGAATGAVIVHYTATAVERVSAKRSLTIRWQVWLSGAYSRIDYSVGQLRAELTSTPSWVEEYLAPARGNEVLSGRLAKGAATCTPTLVMCGFRAVDPVALVRALVRTDALARDGSTVLNGRTLDVLQGPRGGRVVVPGHPGVALRVLVDPDTSVPVEILVGHAGTAGWTKIRISGYERLALTAESEKLLQMSPHPGASHACRRFYPDNSAGNC